MLPRPVPSTALSLALAVTAAACGGRARPQAPTPPEVTAVPPTTIKVGECGVPERDGVAGPAPTLARADRDLDGDGRPEQVVADRGRCTEAGNCYWNVFLPADDGGCARFAGTLAGAYLEPGPASAPGVPAPVRAYWALGGGRLLVSDYEFRRGGYALVGTLVCRREDDERLQCTEDRR